MWFARTHSILAGLVMLMFSALLMAPCFCATAMATEAEDADDSGCCPEQAAQESDPQEDPGEEEGCCCTTLSACGQSDGVTIAGDGGAVISTFDEDDAVDRDGTWWTPDLVATLWLVDRLSTAFETPSTSEEIPPHKLRPDRSET